MLGRTTQTSLTPAQELLDLLIKLLDQIVGRDHLDGEVGCD